MNVSETVSDPVVSIVIPSFNREHYIRETLDSVSEQTRTDWECIIVDDGSTDDSIEIAQEYAARDERFRLLTRSRTPKGACTCRNIGVAQARGAYLIFLDTDDLLEPFCVENRVAIMEDGAERDFAIFPSVLFEKEPDDLGLWWNVDKPVAEITRQLYQDAICQGTGVIWKTCSFVALGQWDENLHLWQDIELFLRAYLADLKYTKHFDLPPDLQVRRLESSLSRENVFSLPKLESRVAVVTRAANLMKTNGKQKFLSELKYLTAETITGLVRANSFVQAKGLIKWAYRERIFNRDEYLRMIAYKWLHKLRLIKVAPIESWKDRMMKEFSGPDSTLGKIKYVSN